MDFETIDHYTLRCIQHTLYGPQANIRVTLPATQPKYVAKITKNGHFRVYSGSGCPGSKWILKLLTIIPSDASCTPSMGLRQIFASLSQRPDRNTLLKSRK